MVNSIPARHQHVSIVFVSMLAMNSKHAVHRVQPHRATRVAVDSWIGHTDGLIKHRIIFKRQSKSSKTARKQASMQQSIYCPEGNKACICIFPPQMMQPLSGPICNKYDTLFWLELKHITVILNMSGCIGKMHLTPKFHQNPVSGVGCILCDNCMNSWII